jgi:hypothetical protein
MDVGVQLPTKTTGAFRDGVNGSNQVFTVKVGKLGVGKDETVRVVAVSVLKFPTARIRYWNE